jgi:DNA (cytosine-5)-methyltransferase 1
MNVGSLFTGIGGGDLGLERAGMACLWQIENNRQCNEVLARHWPHVTRYGTIQEVDPHGLARPDLIIAGDPCPCRSRARGNHGSTSPDLFPEVLRFVSALRPRWVLRENVVATDVDECAEAIARLGYAVVIAEVDSAQVTGARRPRQYILGVSRSAGICPVHALSLAEGDRRDSETGEEAEATHPCLSTNPRRWDTRDGYLSDPVHPTLMTKSGRGDHNAREAFINEQSGLRILSVPERLRLQGFPDNWLDGYAFTPGCRMVGNAMTVPVVEHFGRAIVRAETRP